MRIADYIQWLPFWNDYRKVDHWSKTIPPSVRFAAKYDRSLSLKAGIFKRRTHREQRSLSCPKSRVFYTLGAFSGHTKPGSFLGWALLAQPSKNGQE